MRIQVVIDRIEENDLAVLEIEGVAGDFLWPVKFLPPAVHEGSVLDVRLELNVEAELSRRDKINSLQEELLKKKRS